jgi:hypothetical protein
MTAEDHVRSMEAVMLSVQILVMNLIPRPREEQRLQIVTWAATGKLPRPMADILLDELGLAAP